MKRKWSVLFPAIAACISLAGCDFNIFGGKTKIKIDDPFYAGYDYTKTGMKLQQELQKHLWAKHVKFIAYQDVNKYYGKTTDRNSIEAVEDGSGYNEYFYTGKVATGYGTREHVWPCAQSDQMWAHNGKENPNIHNVDYEYYMGAGSDLYHIRTCTNSVNTARGDSRFTDFDDSTSVAYEKRDTVTEYGDTGPYKLKLQGYEGTATTPKYANFAEPADNVKGDIARIILYVYVHYGNKNQEFDGQVKSGSLVYKYNEMIGDLVLTSVMGYKTNKRCQEVLQEWNKMDPPSEVEKLRNNTVQRIQGNRNPFVDYPELVDNLF